MTKDIFLVRERTHMVGPLSNQARARHCPPIDCFGDAETPAPRFRSRWPREFCGSSAFHCRAHPVASEAREEPTDHVRAWPHVRDYGHVQPSPRGRESHPALNLSGLVTMTVYFFIVNPTVSYGSCHRRRWSWGQWRAPPLNKDVFKGQKQLKYITTQHFVKPKLSFVLK